MEDKEVMSLVDLAKNALEHDRHQLAQSCALLVQAIATVRQAQALERIEDMLYGAINGDISGSINVYLMKE